MIDTTKRISKVTYNGKNIPLVGGAQPTGGEKEVFFYDYDGSLVKSCSHEEALAFTSLPVAPDHSSNEIPLTFDGWNWTIPQIISQINEVGGDVVIGALYHPTDSKCHLIAKIADADYMSVRIKYSGSVDWGDGVTETSDGSVFTYHTYASTGRYHIKVTGTALQIGDDLSGDDSETVEYCLSNIYEVYLNNGSPFYVENLKNLRILTVPYGATSAPYDATYSCDMLKALIIPSSITEYDEYAVSAMAEVVSVAVGITDMSGVYLNYLRHITMPVGVSGIPMLSNRYSGYARKIESLAYPSTAEGLSLYNLDSYTKAPIALRKLIIRTTDVSFDSYPFQYCYALETVELAEGINVDSGLFGSCVNLKTVRLPADTTSLNGTFYSCYNLREVEVPASVTEMDDYTFYNAYNLDRIVMLPTNPPALSDSPSWTIRSIVVPRGCLSAYQSATNWSSYASKMVEADE